VETTQFGRGKLVGRAADYLSFYAAAWRQMMRLVNKQDALVAMTDPPLMSIPAMYVARRRGAYLVNWLQDIYPEIALQLGVPLVRGPAFNLIAALRDRSFKAATANVVLGDRMADKVASRRVSNDRIHLIANWCDDRDIEPIAAAANPLRREWQIEDKFVVGYSGNLGRAHEYDTLLATAEILQNRRDIVFLFIGGGHLIDQLATRAKGRSLSNLKFMEYQPRNLLKLSLGVPDVHWISLQPAVEGLIVPSKVYGIAAAGRPMIAICARDGEIARMVDRFKCGAVVEPGQSHILAEEILRLRDNPELCTTLGQRARAMLDMHYTRQQSLARWAKLIDQLPSARHMPQ
jgi:glycosyltransferase involved in cell wall biosynthesis